MALFALNDAVMLRIVIVVSALIAAVVGFIIAVIHHQFEKPKKPTDQPPK